MTLHIGDSLSVLRTLPDQSVHTCVTSPPYFGLRDYGMNGQIGLEDTPDAFVARLVEVFREVRRVLRDDGTLWVNLGDSYAANRSYQVEQTKGGPKHGVAQAVSGRKQTASEYGLKQKDLIGIPWRVAFALQSDGWYLRQDIIWHKPNPMPESITDRCTKAHEYIFMLSKSPRYFFDSEAIKEEAVYAGNQKSEAKGSFGGKRSDQDSSVIGQSFRHVSATRNRRSVWTVTTKPFKGAHFATFPPDLIEPCVLSGAPEKCCSACGAPFEREIEIGEPDREHQIACGGDALGQYDGKSTKDYAASRAQDASATKARILAGMRKRSTIGFTPTCTCGVPAIGGTVLDPFFGAGTTGLVSERHGRQWEGIELNPEYAAIASDRIHNARPVVPLKQWLLIA